MLRCLYGKWSKDLQYGTFSRKVQLWYLYGHDIFINSKKFIFLDVETIGSISICEMLFRTNIIAMVSGGSRPKIPDNILHIYDDSQKKAFLQIKFASSIKAVRLRRDKYYITIKYIKMYFCI